jgi:ketosteroid isomerase-like protein
MSQTEHPNVALVRSAFESVASGDMQTALNVYSPGLHYYGYDTTATPREFGSRDEFFGMVMEAMSYTDEFATELVQAYPVGESLVMAHVRAHRRARQSQETIDDDFVMAFRIEDGHITHGFDLCGPALLHFWSRTSGV